jgi:hypothetical protein
MTRTELETLSLETLASMVANAELQAYLNAGGDPCDFVTSADLMTREELIGALAGCHARPIGPVLRFALREHAEIDGDDRAVYERRPGQPDTEYVGMAPLKLIRAAGIPVIAMRQMMQRSWTTACNEDGTLAEVTDPKEDRAW